MNSGVQILIGMVPAVLILLIYIILERKHVIPVLAAAVFVCFAGGICYFTDTKTMNVEEDLQQKWKRIDTEKVEKGIAEAKDYYALIECLIADEAWDEAERLLDETIRVWGYEPRATLAKARTKEGKGDFAAAEALYKKAEIEGVVSEEEREEYEEIAHTVNEISQVYSMYADQGILEEERAVQIYQDFKEYLDDNEELQNIAMIRDAFMKSAILSKNYTDIASQLDKESEIPEIMVASQLYIDGYVEDDDFTEAYVESNKKQINEVRDQLKKISSKSTGELQEKADKLEDRYVGFKNGGVAFQMEQDLLEAAAQQNVSSSKIYLQLAKMELNKGDEKTAGRYINESFKTADFDRDINYTLPMYQIIALMGEKNDAEGLKQLELYTENILNNQLDVILPATTDEFKQFVSDKAIQSRVSVNIMDIDASAFNTVKADFQFEAENEKDVKEQILVEDCGTEISEFQIEKIQYDSARILLCCDVSGSMSGKPIADLREAIKMMASSELGNVEIAIVAFSNDANLVLDFTNDREKVASAADQLKDGGGTQIANAVQYSLEHFGSSKADSMDYIVVLSDGQSSDSQYIEQISRDAEARGIVVHSLGLGDGVDANYLETLARSTGGTYSYVSNSETLNSFYKSLQTRKEHSYRVEYKAEDELLRNRTLKISAKGEEYRYDEKAYYLDGISEENATDDLVLLQDKRIHGLDTRFMIRSDKNSSAKLLGSGFLAEDSMALEMTGDRSYKIEAEFIDEGSYTVQIPANAACGTYDLAVRLNGKEIVLKDELTIVSAEDVQIVEFGEYIFTAYQKTQGDNFIYLDGFVTLNDWLHFNGGVYLYGDISGDYITLSESEGCYMEYQPSAVGLAGILESQNQLQEIPALGDVKLCRDMAKNGYGKIAELSLGNYLLLQKPSYRLEPYAIRLEFNELQTRLPGQVEIFGKDKDDIFVFSIDTADAVLTGESIQIQMESIANERVSRYYPYQMGKWDISLRPSGVIKLDTISNEYSLNMGIKMNFFDGDGVTLQMKWHGTDELLPYDFNISDMLGFEKMLLGVPVTVKNLFLNTESMDPDDLMNTMWSGSCNLEFGDLQSSYPELYEQLAQHSIERVKNVELNGTYKYEKDEFHMIDLDTIAISGSWNDSGLQMDAILNLMGNIDCGEVTFETGTGSYTENLAGQNRDGGIVLRTEVSGIDDEGVLDISQFLNE